MSSVCSTSWLETLNVAQAGPELVAFHLHQPLLKYQAQSTCSFLIRIATKKKIPSLHIEARFLPYLYHKKYFCETYEGPNSAIV